MTDPISFDPFLGWVDTTDPDNLPPEVRIIGAADLLRYENFGVGATSRINSLITGQETLEDSIGSAEAGVANLNNVGGDWSQVPNLRKVLNDYNPGNPTPIKVLGLGGTVAEGAYLPDPADQAPVQLFAQWLRDVFDVEVEVFNGAVPGSNMGDATDASADYAEAKTAAGWMPDVVFIAYGMLEGTANWYHGGGSLAGVRTHLSYLIDAVQIDAADPIVATVPHPHTTRATWVVEEPWTPIWWPTDETDTPVQVPNSTAAQSIATGDPIGAGINVPHSVRHRRVNMTLAMEGSNLGVPVLDVERFWFLAVNQLGQDALHSTAPEAWEPNAAGILNSYGMASKAFWHGLANAVGRAGRPVMELPLIYTTNEQVRTATTTLADDSVLKRTFRENMVIEFEAVLYVTTPAAADFKVAIAGTNGVSGRWGVQGVSVGGLPITGNVILSGTGTEQEFVLKGLITTGPSGGTISVQWAQGTSDAGDTIRMGYSHLKTRVVGF